MEAVIVAAGSGLRLGCIGRHTPKCLLKVGGQTLLQRQLRSLQAAGVKRVTVTAGHLAGLVEDALADGPPGLATRLVLNGDYRQTGGAYSFLLGSADIGDDLIYTVCDMVCHPQVYSRLGQGAAEITLGIQRRATAPEDMKAILDGRRVARIGKDIRTERADGEFVGAAFVPRRSLSELRRGFESLLSGETGRMAHFGNGIGGLIAAGMEIGWSDLSDLWWCEIDCIRDLSLARASWEENKKNA